MARKQGVILSYILMIFEVLSTLLLTPYLIRTLGQSEYGVYKLSASITAYLLLLDLGVGNAIIRFVSKYRTTGDKESEKKFFGVSMIFYMAIAVLTLIIGAVLIALFPVLFSKGLNSSEIALGQKLLIITILNVAVTIGTTVYTNVIIGYERFAVSKGIPIIQILARVLLTVVTLKMGMGSVGIVLTNLFVTVLCRGFFVLYVFVAIKLRPKFEGISFGFIKEVLLYSCWILVQMLATQINVSMDQILLGGLVANSAAIIAVYSVGTQIVQYFQSIGSSFTNVMMPGIVKLVEGNDSSEILCKEMVRIGRIILIVLGVIFGGFLAFGEQFIFLWAGEVNKDAYIVSSILMAAYVFILPESIGTQILWAKNEHKEQALLKLCIVLINIVLTIVLIHWDPLLGATIGTFISLFLGDILVMNIVFVKKIKISLRQYYLGLLKGLMPCIVIATGAGFALSLIPLFGWLGLAFKIGFMCMIYAGLLWTVGMNKYEKNLLRSLLRVKQNIIKKN